MNRKLVAIAAAVVTGLCAACAGEAEVENAGSGGPGAPAGAAGSKEDAYVGDLKADCFNCDASNLRPAVVQAGVAGRFLRRGDHFTVAYRATNRTGMRMVEVAPGADLDLGTTSDVYLINYAVSGVHKRVFGDYRRSVATIEVTQGDVDNSLKGVVGGERIDSHEQMVVLELNDLLEAVSKRYFTSQYRHGVAVELSQATRIRAVSDVFPTSVPNLDLAQTGTGRLELTGPLAAVAEKAAAAGLMPADWAEAEYRIFRIDGETTYWRRDDLWPTYVESDRGESLLVQQIEG